MINLKAPTKENYRKGGDLRFVELCIKLPRPDQS